MNFVILLHNKYYILNLLLRKLLTVLFLELVLTQGEEDTPTEVCTQKQTYSN